MKHDLARDKAIEKLVGTQIRAGLRPGSASCPDAEILAAYVERILTPAELRTCQAHLASCAGCQALVAELIRLSEGEEPLGVRAAAPAPTRSAWTSPFRWAWAGTALAAMLIAGIWLSREWQIPQPSRETSAPAALPAANESAPPPSSPATKEPAASETLKLAEAQRVGREKTKSLEAEKELKALHQIAGRPEPPSPAPSDLTSPHAAPPASLGQAGAAAAKPPALRGRFSAARSAEIATPSERADLTKAAPSEGPRAGPGAAPSGAPGGVAQGAGIPAEESKIKDVRASAPPPPPPPAAQLAVESVREAARPENEARAEQSKAARSTPADKFAAPGPSGTVSGTVTDPSGAVIPSATITVRNTSTNVATVLTTNNAGAYVAPTLNPGVYEIQADANGFRTSVVKDVTLEPDATHRVDFALQVGAAAQTVAVTAAASPLQSEQSSLGKTKKQRSIHELPTQSRNYRAPSTQTAPPVWRVGPQGLILEGDSKGTWKKHESGVKRDLFSVSFCSAAVGWVVGERGTILRTTDGGQNWTRMPSPTDADLTKVSSTNALSVAVTTRAGLTFATTDGGRTWTETSP